MRHGRSREECRALVDAEAAAWEHLEAREAVLEAAAALGCRPSETATSTKLVRISKAHGAPLGLTLTSRLELDSDDELVSRTLVQSVSGDSALAGQLRRGDVVLQVQVDGREAGDDVDRAMAAASEVSLKIERRPTTASAIAAQLLRRGYELVVARRRPLIALLLLLLLLSPWFAPLAGVPLPLSFVRRRMCDRAGRRVALSRLCRSQVWREARRLHRSSSLATWDCAVVGASGRLSAHRLRMGERIDRHSVIWRVSDGAHVGTEEAVGKRTHVLLINDVIQDVWTRRLCAANETCVLRAACDGHGTLEARATCMSAARNLAAEHDIWMLENEVIDDLTPTITRKVIERTETARWWHDPTGQMRKTMVTMPVTRTISVRPTVSNAYVAVQLALSACEWPVHLYGFDGDPKPACRGPACKASARSRASTWHERLEPPQTDAHGRAQGQFVSDEMDVLRSLAEIGALTFEKPTSSSDPSSQRRRPTQQRVVVPKQAQSKAIKKLKLRTRRNQNAQWR